MLYRYQPAIPSEMIPVLGLMQPGDVVDLDDERAAFALANTVGEGGGPCIAPADTPLSASDRGAEAPQADPSSVVGSAILSAVRRKPRGPR